MQCLVCRTPIERDGLCHRHKRHFLQAWCVAERHDGLERLIDSYKFQNNQDSARMIGVLLSRSMGRIPKNTHLVPVPTISPHIRQRGFDHTKLMAQVLRKYTGAQITPVVTRRENSIQRGASRGQRLRQSAQAFEVSSRYQIDPEHLYIIIDDVYTTGATVTMISRLLRAAGAERIAVAVGTRQVLDS